MSAADGDVLWAGWRTGVFGEAYTMWHDGPDFHRLLEAATEDLPGTGHMLALGITLGDPLAPLALGVLGRAGLTPDGAVELLRAAVPGASGTFLVRLAQAVHALTGDESGAAWVVSVLVEHPNWYDRMDAAIALRDFTPTRAVVAALARAARDDPDELVRSHCAD